MPNRRTLLKHLALGGALGGAGVSGVSGLSGLIRDALANGVKPLPPGIHAVTGDVRVNGQAAKVGTLVKAGDTVTTGPDSQATFVIGTDAFLQHDKAEVRFGADGMKEFMRVVTGRLLSVFGSGAKTLAVPTATIGIRGTGCYIESEAERAYFCLCYGGAEIVPAGEPAPRYTIATQHHDHPVYLYAGSAREPLVSARVINHTDRELTMLENLCGRWPPFYGKEPFLGGGY